MRTITVLFFIIIAFLFSGTIYLFILNRSSDAIRSKIIPALVIGLTGTLLTVWFSLKSEQIDDKFRSIVIYHKGNKQPMEIPCSGRDPFYKEPQFGVVVSNAIHRLLEDDGLSRSKDSQAIITDLSEFYMEAMITEIVSNLFVAYADRWYVDFEESVDTEGRTIRTWFKAPNLPNLLVSWQEFTMSIQPTSNLEKLLQYVGKSTPEMVCLPKGTKISGRADRYIREIILINPFVEVYIAVRLMGGSLGLGEYKLLLGYEEEKNKEFWTANYRILLRANFEKLRSGHPLMPMYKHWVNTMFERIRMERDSERKLKRLREYHHLYGR